MSLAIALALMAQTVAKPRPSPTPRAAPIPPPSPFQGATDNFLLCMQHLVSTSEITRTPPAEFATSFATSCKSEEANFRAEAIRVAVAQGRTPEAAAAEVDANIANSRRAFVADQAAYIAPTKGPAPQATPTPVAKKKRSPRATGRKTH